MHFSNLTGIKSQKEKWICLALRNNRFFKEVSYEKHVISSKANSENGL